MATFVVDVPDYIKNEILILFIASPRRMVEYIREELGKE